MKTSKLTAGMFLLLLFGSCQKQINPPPRNYIDSPGLNFGIETIDWSAAENSGNPADSAGFIHNVAI